MHTFLQLVAAESSDVGVAKGPRDRDERSRLIRRVRIRSRSVGRPGLGCKPAWFG
jgi:hypothetical protein